MTLDEIPSGQRVLIDAPVFIYHFTGASLNCRHFLERCERRELKGLVSTLTLAEVTHRLMMIEAVANGHVKAGNVAKKLGRRPEVVRKLTIYSNQVEKIPLMGIQVVPLDLNTLLSAPDLRLRFGLLANDSLVAATAAQHEVQALATADRDFDRVDGLKAYHPSDL